MAVGLAPPGEEPSGRAQVEAACPQGQADRVPAREGWCTPYLVFLIPATPRGTEGAVQTPSTQGFCPTLLTYPLILIIIVVNGEVSLGPGGPHRRIR